MSIDDRSLGETIENNARWYSNRLAVATDDRHLTHVQFAERCRMLASGLAKLGLRHQDRFCVLAQNCLEYLEAYGAAEISGMILATVNYRLAPPEMDYIIADAAPAAVIFETAYSDYVATLRHRRGTIKHFIAIGPDCPDWAEPFESVVDNGDAGGPPFRAKGEDIAYVIYTSGTTGRPKGCLLGHSNQIASSHMTALHMGNGCEDRTLAVMPLYHIGAKNIQLAQHWVGGAVYLHRAFRPLEALKAIAADRITVGHMAPTMIQMLLEEPSFSSFDLSSLRMILYSAAPMPLPLLRQGLEQIGPVFAQIYGQTEALGTILPIDLHRPGGDADDLRRLASVGHPYSGVRMRCVDEDDNPVGVGEAGEICIQGHCVMRGYWNDSPATMEALRGGWLHTGDIGMMDHEGYFHLLDRKKDVIISGGENIYSREVEAALAEHPDVADVAVVGMPDEKWGEAVTAVIISRRPDLSPEEIEAHSRTFIAGYKTPRRIYFVSEFPKLPSGKINKVELRAQLQGREA